MNDQKVKKILTLSTIGFFLTACSHDKDCCTDIDTAISIKYPNEVGENPFNPDNGPSESHIIVYHRIDDGWIEYFEGNLDYPRGIRTVERTDGTYLVVFPNTELAENDCSETKSGFQGYDPDIIKTKIDKSSFIEIVTKVWYPDEKIDRQPIEQGYVPQKGRKR